jgi:hypothetical protein
MKLLWVDADDAVEINSEFNSIILYINSPRSSMDRAPDFESVGSEFESRRGRHIWRFSRVIPLYMGVFFFSLEGVRKSGATGCNRVRFLKNLPHANL